ncbi:hypothetical protein GCM10009765_42280 [Fodinicola feengrottensis]|uniref:Fibronectin type-III domain-containing protein n=1 Tax=Fodinicola feengrottensis TaxID=435914 RepID=A0ABN2HI73_9ACTN
MSWKFRALTAAVALSAGLALAVPAAVPANADTAPPAGTPATVTADPLSTWQTDGIVWALARSGSTVFAGGNFNDIRPPGAAAGASSQQSRSNLAAFDIASGAPTTFNHPVTGTAYTSTTNPGPECDSVGTNKWLCDAIFGVAAAPDGKAVYFGGDFTAVDGHARSRFAGINLSTGALEPISATINSRVRAVAVSATTVYIGGNFTTVNGQPRTRLAAFDRATGALLPWNPSTDNTVRTMALSTDGSRVIVGGDFDHLNGSNENSIGAVSSTGTGALTPWSTPRPIPPRNGTQYSGVTDVVVVGPTVFAGAHGEGGGVFDGRLAVDTATGKLLWKDTCLGATTTIAVQNGVVYSGSHAHDCSSMGGWGQTNPATYQRLLAETADSGGASKNQLLHWFPQINYGPTSSYYKQGPWSMANDDKYLWVGGEFTQVGGVAQQGLTHFATTAVKPDINAPEVPFAAPTVATAGSKTLKVTWKTTWDRDNAKLTYEVIRDNGSTPVYTTTASTNFWTLPSLSFTDTGLASGSSHYYRIRVSDPYGNARSSPNSTAVVAS